MARPVGGGHVFSEVTGRRVVPAGCQVLFGCRALVAASIFGLFGSCRVFLASFGCVVAGGRVPLVRHGRVAVRSGVLLVRSWVVRRRRPRGGSQKQG